MRRLLLLTGALVWVDTMFFAALTPLLPHFVDELGLSKTSAGVLAAMYPAGAFFGGIPSALAISRLGVKPTALIGLSLLVVTTVTFGWAESEVVLDVARFAQGFSSAATWTAAFTWLVDAAPVERRGELIGSALAAAIVGALFGPVVGGVASVAGIGPTFTAVAGLAVVMAVWAWATPSPPPQQHQPLRLLFGALRRPSMLLAVWFVALPGLLFGSLGVLASLRLDVLGWGALAIGAVWLVSAALEAAVSPIAGRLSDRRGRLLPLRAGLAASAVAAVLLPWPGDAWVLAPVVVAAAIAFGTFWAPAMSHLTDLADSQGLEYGFGFALVNMAWAPGQTLGSSGGGALADATDDWVVYVLLAAICLATLGLLRRAHEPVAAPAPAAR